MCRALAIWRQFRVGFQHSTFLRFRSTGKYEEAGKRIQLRHLSRDCHQLLTKAGHLMIDSDDDPDYEIAVDYQVRTGILSGH